MKKIILSATIIMAAISVNAQNKFGLQGGANFATINLKQGNVETNFITRNRLSDRHFHTD